MSEIPSIRDSIRAELDGAELELSLRARQTLERALIKAIVSRLAIDGYKISALAVLTGVPANTIRSWRDKDPVFAEQLGGAEGLAHAKLRAILWKKAAASEPGTPGVGQSINVLSNLHFPELRSSKVETTPATPEPGEAARVLLELVSKGEDKTEPDAV